MTENIAQPLSTLPVKLSDLDLAALLSSLICHDLVSPVGAIINGLEVLDDEEDEQMRGFAMDLIKKSADQASAKLQFARLAFGAAGSATAMIDLADLNQVTQGFAASDKVTVVWSAPVGLVGKDFGKLLLNMVLIGLGAIPRGGELNVLVEGALEAPNLSVMCAGVGARVPPEVVALLAGQVSASEVDARSIQPYFTGLVARSAGMAVKVAMQEERVLVSTAPA
ncbi:MAG: histidine phosphotransferase ChpT [Alphaproteobacteria bacterium]